MSKPDFIQLFVDQPIRAAWNVDAEKWRFSVADVVSALAEQATHDGACNYWRVLKKRLKDEGSELIANCNQPRMRSPKDGKRYLTDVTETEQLQRIIQSILSSKAEPFKLWLAQVSHERIEEIIDVEQTIDRALKTYLKKSY